MLLGEYRVTLDNLNVARKGLQIQQPSKIQLLIR
jgi:hypothetical protein